MASDPNRAYGMEDMPGADHPRDKHELTASERSHIIVRITTLQNTRDYAAPELEPRLTAEIERLLELLKPKKRGTRCST
jgi:hypothetical protein